MGLRSEPYMLLNNGKTTFPDLSSIPIILTCSGGPRIAYRGGRIDAKAPNNPGVPEPQGTLATHIADFARQGFTQTEMIQLVACGHTIGGVQGKFFPTVIPATTTDRANIVDHVTFDSTFTFDNAMLV
jgi:hypothetical protein